MCQGQSTVFTIAAVAVLPVQRQHLIFARRRRVCEGTEANILGTAPAVLYFVSREYSSHNNSALLLRVVTKELLDRFLYLSAVV